MSRTQLNTIEERLRRSTPELHVPDPTRVAKVCARIASSPPASPLRETHTFTKPLLRVAACLALLFGVALLVRPKTQARPVPALPAVATFHDLAALMGQHELANSLATEADNLTDDLSDLTAALNDRSMAILF